jgi:hypothetical protein
MIKNILEASEEQLLSVYLNSRGINPKFVTKDTKISHAKSAEFAKWKADHQDDRRFSEETKKINESKPTSLEKFRRAAAEREKKHAEIEKQSKEKPDMKGAIDRLEKHLNKEETGVSKAKETKFHTSLDKLVHKTFGPSPSEKKEKQKMKKEEVEQIDEISKSTLNSYRDKSSASLKNAKMNRDASEPGKNMSKGFADLHAKSNAIAKKRVKGLTGYLQRKHGMKPGYEDQRKPTSEETVSEVYSTGVQGHVSQAALDSIKGKRNVQVNLGTPTYKPKPKTLVKKPSKRASILSKILNREDTHQDSYAATQTTGMEVVDLPADEKYSRKKELSKSARIIKSMYKKLNMKEELYDHEKEDKSVATYGKKPTMVKAEKKLGLADNQPQAAAVLSGGKTLTGQTRDTLEIDPLMKKPGPPIDQNKKV